MFSYRTALLIQIVRAPVVVPPSVEAGQVLEEARDVVQRGTGKGFKPASDEE